jgi:uncharacterized protein YPO0396
MDTNAIIDPLVLKILSGGGGLGLFLYLAARYLPGILSAYKRETLDQATVEAQQHAVEALDVRLAKAEERITVLNEKVHQLQVRNTRFVSLFIKIEAYLDKDKLPQAIIDELDALIKES